MASAVLDGAGRAPAAAAIRDRFAWRRLLLVWLAVSAILIACFWHAIVTQDYSDADDLMRLLEVRDLLNGQSWFDLTQYRLDPPFGLVSHWSRLVDVPLAALIAPLTPLVGATAAETVATTAVPLITLGLTMAAALAAVRRTTGRDPLFVLLVPLILVTAPPILMQMFPTRIDHHGWQIFLATVAFAALVDAAPRRSGAIAGLAVALLTSISLEGLPFAVAVTVCLAVPWAIGREHGARLTAFLATLALASAASFVLTAPALRWTTGYCDVVKPAHLATFVFAAAGAALVVRLTAARGAVARFAALCCLGALSLALFAALAPNCLGSPFGAMDPLVRRFWYDHVLEGMPVTAQPADGVATMVIFPLIGLIGAAVALIRAGDGECRRRWLLVLILGLFTFALGVLVRRDAGIADIIAIPGALVLIQALRPRIEAIPNTIVRVPLMAALFLALTPIAPIWAASAAAPKAPAPTPAPTVPNGCDWRCGMAAIGRLPAAVMFTEVDISPRLIAMTHHRAYSGGYHRLERPIHQTVAAFIGTPAQARTIICTGRFDYVLVAPNSGETTVYRRAAPRGFLAELLEGRTPPWLDRVPLPNPDLELYRIRRSADCRSAA
jgi:hypothetical protein